LTRGKIPVYSETSMRPMIHFGTERQGTKRTPANPAAFVDP